MKRLISLAILAAFLCITLSLPAYADEDKKSGLFSYTIKGNGTAVITGFDWNSNHNQDVYVPKMVDGYTVTGIGEMAFSNSNASLEKPVGEAVTVMLPDTLNVIGEKAFFCTKVNSVPIPASVQLIGSGAFAGCINLKQHAIIGNNDTFAIIDGVLYNKADKELLSYPFGRKIEADIGMPSGIIAIGDYAFYGLCANGFNVSIPNSVRKIGEYAFSYASNIGTKRSGGNTGKFYMSCVNDIGAHAFERAHIGVIHFDQVEIIGEYAFNEAVVWTSTDEAGVWDDRCLEFPSTLRHMGKNAFSNVNESEYKIVTIDLSQTCLTSIPKYAFSECGFNYSITVRHKLLLPRCLTTIEEGAFYKLGSLGYSLVNTYCFIPASLETISAKAFSNAGIDLVFADNSSLKEIGDEAFYDSAIFNESLVLPDGLESIGSKAFNSSHDTCKSISIPASVKSIGNNVCDRSITKLVVEHNSYADIYAQENGIPVSYIGGDDTSWLNG